MTRFLLICLGGAAGTGARYLIGSWSTRILGAAFPYGTLIVNAAGSFLIVVVMVLARQRGLLSEDARLILATGVLGGFTTYSAFNYETLALFSNGTPGLALLNVAATLFGCLAAGGLAMLTMRLVAP
jgi:CrcB protein